MMSTIQVDITLEVCKCARCHVPFAIPDYMRRNLRQSQETFYCPSGHPNWYPQETDEQKLQRELRRKEQELSDLVVAKLNVESELKNANRKLKRVDKGVCPCCNKTFINLQRHMNTKHKQ